MLQQLNKDQVKDMVEKMKLDNKDLEKQLDRTLELFKQLEVEQKLKEAISKPDELAKEQNKLAEKSEEAKTDNKELEKAG
ncbi:MAG: hypothetical protein IPL74_12300 [Bacteroidetes bacterium]|nr:hypothetical protein [Bacteroidota bacterium]